MTGCQPEQEWLAPARRPIGRAAFGPSSFHGFTATAAHYPGLQLALQPHHDQTGHDQPGGGDAEAATARTTGAVIERLVRDHQDAIRTYLSFLGASGDLVDDLVQETFLSFLGSTFQERDPASTRAYLRTVARNHLLKEFRRIGTRFEKLAIHFHGMLQLAMITRYLRLLFSDSA